MGKVRVLSDDLVTLIAAGEVIEGPASVVKELIENALDAEASQIDIEIRNGGIDYISVSDNGEGIHEEDLPIAIKRHSTSKIQQRSDIEAILTYGFRGEALASIAAVADLKITTRTKAVDTATILISRATEEPKILKTARNVGTTVEVENLFTYLPARKKHLSSPGAESHRVSEVVLQHAIVRNDIGFRLIRDDEYILDCPAGQTRKDRISMIWGVDVAKNAIPVKHSTGGVTIEGFVVRPPISRGNRGREYLSVLKRPIQDDRLCKSVEAAYATLLMRGRFPIFALDINLERRRVDANVHPAKQEVRIQDIESISLIIQRVVREALSQESPPELIGHLEDFSSVMSEKDIISSEDDIHRRKSSSETILVDSIRLIDGEQDAESITLDELGGIMRIIGQLHNLYILLEGDDGLVVVDQHAAHERIMYEQFRKKVNEGHIVSQELLEPAVLKMNQTNIERILDLKDELESLGYAISSFGGNEVLISSVPEILGRHTSESDLLSLVDEILDIGTEKPKRHFMDELVKVTACHGAIRAGRVLSHEEIKKLLLEILDTPNRYSCPHGRPTVFKLTLDELERRFKRT